MYRHWYRKFHHPIVIVTSSVIYPQSLASRETHIHELQQQVLLLSQGEAARSSEQQARLGALISSFNQLRETCEQQVREDADDSRTLLRQRVK